MENLNYNLAEEEFSRSKKLLLWIFASLFFLAGIGIVFMNVILHDKSINISLSSAPFGISLVVGIIAIMATFNKSDNYFNIDNEKIEFKYGMMNPQKQTYLWENIKEVHFPHKQRKVKLVMKDDSSSIVNLIWIEKKKSSLIRKHLYYAVKEKNINIITVQVLS
jgi:hypothetical protein